MLYFVLFSQLSLNQQKASSSNLAGEQEIVSTYTEKNSEGFFVCFDLETKIVKKYYTVGCYRHLIWREWDIPVKGTFDYSPRDEMQVTNHEFIAWVHFF